MFLVNPAEGEEEVARLTRYLLACIAGDLKVLRLPALCVLLMVSRYPAFQSAGIPVIREADPKILSKVLHNIGGEAEEGGSS